METQETKVINHESVTIHPTNEIFSIVEKDNQFKIGVNGHFVSNKSFNSLMEAESYITSKPYELIFNTTILLIQQLQEYEIQQKLLEQSKRESKTQD